MGGGHPEPFFEKYAEGKSALEPNRLTYITDGQIIIFQQSFGFFQFQVDKVLMWGNGIDLFEHTEKMLTVHGCDGGDVLQRSAVLEIGFHPIFCRRDAFKDLQPGGGFQGLYILRLYICLLVFHHQVFEQSAYGHIRLQCGKGTAAGAQFDERDHRRINTGIHVDPFQKGKIIREGIEGFLEQDLAAVLEAEHYQVGKSRMKEKQGGIGVLPHAFDGQRASAADKKHLALIQQIFGAINIIVTTAVGRDQQPDIRWTVRAFVGLLQLLGKQEMIVINRRSDLVLEIERLRHSLEDHWIKIPKK